MDNKQRTTAILVLIASVITWGCSIGRLLSPEPTASPIPVSTATRTPIPTPTTNPEPPLFLDAVDCGELLQNTGSMGWGRVLKIRGSLVVPAGSFDINAPTYQIWLAESPYLGADAILMDVVVPGGDKSNSMYFDAGGTPRIKNNSGEVLNWLKDAAGYEVYKTYQQLIVTGVWRGRCPFVIDTIEAAFLYD